MGKRVGLLNEEWRLMPGAGQFGRTLLSCNEGDAVIEHLGSEPPDKTLALVAKAPRMARAVLATEYHATSCCGCTPACPECGAKEGDGHEEECDHGALCDELRKLEAEP